MRRFDLAGKVAVVTGGKSGIGLGIPRALAERGAAVVIAGRNAAKNRASVAELAGLGGGGGGERGRPADVTDGGQCRAMVAEG